MRYITLNENNKIIGIREGSKPVGNEIESDLGLEGQLMQDDGSFIDDPQDEIDKLALKAQANKKEAYNEYVEQKEIHGEISDQAQSAKTAYLAITDECPGKSRYDLEQELNNAEQSKLDALDAQMLELIEGGVI